MKGLKSEWIAMIVIIYNLTVRVFLYIYSTQSTRLFLCSFVSKKNYERKIWIDIQKWREKKTKQYKIITTQKNCCERLFSKNDLVWWSLDHFVTKPEGQVPVFRTVFKIHKWKYSNIQIEILISIQQCYTCIPYYRNADFPKIDFN